MGLPRESPITSCLRPSSYFEIDVRRLGSRMWHVGGGWLIRRSTTHVSVDLAQPVQTQRFQRNWLELLVDLTVVEYLEGDDPLLHRLGDVRADVSLILRRMCRPRARYEDERTIAILDDVAATPLCNCGHVIRGNTNALDEERDAHEVLHIDVFLVDGRIDVFHVDVFHFGGTPQDWPNIRMVVLIATRVADLCRSRSGSGRQTHPVRGRC